MSYNTTIKQHFLDAYFGRQVYATVPTSFWLGLENANGNELSGGGYARVEIANSVANFGQATNSSGSAVKTITTNITFPTATIDWQTATQLVFFSAATAGTRLVVLQLFAEIDIKAGGQLVLPADSIQFTQP